MIIYSDPKSYLDQRIRIMIKEKKTDYDVIYIKNNEYPQELIDAGTNLILPTLIERDFAICGINVLVEYLEERIPYPPIFSLTPKDRALQRFFIYSMQNEFFKPLKIMDNTVDHKVYKQMKQVIKNNLLSKEELFKQKLSNAGDNLTIVDCAMIPLLCRLKYYGITNFKKGQAINLFKYLDKYYKHDSVINSMSDFELEIQNKLIDKPFDVLK